jgi:acetylornithine deacetylase
MNVFELTRALVDIESITGNELAVGQCLKDYLAPLARKYGGTVEEMPVEPDRPNILASWGEPVVTLTTRMDTVPPFPVARGRRVHLGARRATQASSLR